MKHEIHFYNIDNQSEVLYTLQLDYIYPLNKGDLVNTKNFSKDVHGKVKFEGIFRVSCLEHCIRSKSDFSMVKCYVSEIVDNEYTRIGIFDRLVGAPDLMNFGL